MYKALILSILTLFFIGCSKNNPSLDTVKSVDIDRYLGTWYEIARYPHSFEEGCSNVSATYSLKDDGKINVLNKCTLEDGTKKEATGVAYASDESNAKLRVSFFRPFYGNYWIIMLDENYSYALVGEPSREYLWILSRTKTIDDNIKTKLMKKILESQYDESKLIWTKHE